MKGMIPRGMEGQRGSQRESRTRCRRLCCPGVQGRGLLLRLFAPELCEKALRHDIRAFSGVDDE
ncbi:MAG: hypothetical protein K9J74_13025 [Sulfuritalea sp.]|nr:hypothetical protein [Sulfuritalea sp.]